MDYIKKAEALEAIAADLRAHAARDTGTAELPLAAVPFTAWAGGDEPPVRGNVDYRLRAMTPGTYQTAPAAALEWTHGTAYGAGEVGADIVEYRLSAEQPEA